MSDTTGPEVYRCFVDRSEYIFRVHTGTAIRNATGPSSGDSDLNGEPQYHPIPPLQIAGESIRRQLGEVAEWLRRIQVDQVRVPPEMRGQLVQIQKIEGDAVDLRHTSIPATRRSEPKEVVWTPR